MTNIVSHIFNLKGELSLFGYIYETVNLVNGKKYIGKRVSNKFLGNKYLGSGTHLHNAIVKYGKENFTVKLIEEIKDFKNKAARLKYLSEREIYWINIKNAVNSKNYYNIAAGGDGWNYDHSGKHNPMYHRTHSEEVKARLSVSTRKNHLGLKYSNETKVKMSTSAKNVWSKRTPLERLEYSKRLSKLNKERVIVDSNYIFGTISQKELNSRNHKRYIIKVVDLFYSKEYYYRGANIFRKYNPGFSTCFFRNKFFHNGIIINNKQIFNLGLEKDLLNSKEFLNNIKIN